MPRHEPESERTFIAVNWGSTNFAAYLIDPAAGVLDEVRAPKGVTKLDRDGIVATIEEVAARWPGRRRTYCSGMIGSNVGWIDVPHLPCPANVGDLGRSLVTSQLGHVSCSIVPGLAATTAHGDPDVLRGEEVEIFGLIADQPRFAQGEQYIILPGTHTKWTRAIDGRVVEFFTSMSGELFDRLAERSLLSSLLSFSAVPDDSFRRGVERGASEGAGLSRLLFGVRAQVLRATLDIRQAASYARGLLIGAEICDSLRLYPALRGQHEVPILGNPGLSMLYTTALDMFDTRGVIADASSAIAGGYCAIHASASGTP